MCFPTNFDINSEHVNCVKLRSTEIYKIRRLFKGNLKVLQSMHIILLPVDDYHHRIKP